MSVPVKENVDRFVKFIDVVLAPRAINTLVLPVGYNYQYTPYPELV